ncbi:MAG: FKBP-type peptidyl-prolyl cis-trans isomerase, partial [Clostridia bacterium]|nr:FKBP-type peptidyl-prolyl cis-trans isomerase [Clostridia bacterium]
GDTTDETGTGTGTGTGTTAETEAATAIPRYDYMSADVAPDVTIAKEDYTNLTLTVPNSLKIEEDDVQDYIGSIRFENRVAVNGTAMVKDKALALGDDAYIYYKGFVDGKEFDGGSNWDDEAPYTLGLGSGSFIPGFEEALVGIVPNTTSKSKPAEITVTFPEDYTEELAGKEATFQIVVEYAVQYTLPAYTRDFVVNTLKYEAQKEFYASDAALLDEFEAYLYDYLVDQNATNVENAKIDALWNHLTEKAVCQNLPATEVAYYFDAYKSEVEYYYDYYKSYGGDEFLAAYPDLGSFAVTYLGFAKGADWEAEITKMSELMVQRDMITHAIAEVEGLETVSEEEFDEQVQYWVEYYYGYMTEEEIIQNMGEVFLTEAAFATKLDAWLMEQVTFTYEDGTPLVSNTDNSTETETSEG